MAPRAKKPPYGIAAPEGFSEDDVQRKTQELVDAGNTLKGRALRAEAVAALGETAPPAAAAAAADGEATSGSTSSSQRGASIAALPVDQALSGAGQLAKGTRQLVPGQVIGLAWLFVLAFAGVLLLSVLLLPDRFGNSPANGVATLLNAVDSAFKAIVSPKPIFKVAAA